MQRLTSEDINSVYEGYGGTSRGLYKENASQCSLNKRKPRCRQVASRSRVRLEVQMLRHSAQTHEVPAESHAAVAPVS